MQVLKTYLQLERLSPDFGKAGDKHSQLVDRFHGRSQVVYGTTTVHLSQGKLVGSRLLQVSCGGRNDAGGWRNYEEYG